MSETQDEMELAERKDAVQADHLAEQMMTILQTRATWLTRKDLAEYGLTERQCRIARQHSHGKIISGQLGYRASGAATLEELRISANTLTSMGRAIQGEAADVWRVIKQRAFGELRP